MFPFSDEELLQPVLMSIEKVRPMLLRDGGNIEVVKIQNTKVFVRLEGACSGCLSRHLTLKNGVEQTLRRDIHPDIEVVEIL
ncbi:hypothetical protein CQA53_01135 [Helicobacter didelphidarum]|uniref:NIF system FeS cluster assembly NifU C-terminal domain-containing protein n=1 Tax=Helicobacter didelphidarum TaxID=2040648 RepID=A0A3D8IQS5_9HELI|nr:NifU family protein [Helicobacter didelphidarum]RDU67638.1 hypothetical protein CQA53_01135 [Helicobacter didelphidarum]